VLGQKTVAGGRYDGLVGIMGGPSTPGIGWASGIERVAMMLREPPPEPRRGHSGQRGRSNAFGIVPSNCAGRDIPSI
jgi:histidyl-tRNA synthetase